jgi:hypothetical protein
VSELDRWPNRWGQVILAALADFTLTTLDILDILFDLANTVRFMVLNRCTD